MTVGVVLSCVDPTLWIPAYAGMMDRGGVGNDGHPVVLPLWIADQVRNDGDEGAGSDSGFGYDLV